MSPWEYFSIAQLSQDVNGCTYARTQGRWNFSIPRVISSLLHPCLTNKVSTTSIYLYNSHQLCSAFFLFCVWFRSLCDCVCVSAWTRICLHLCQYARTRLRLLVRNLLFTGINITRVSRVITNNRIGERKWETERERIVQLFCCLCGGETDYRVYVPDKIEWLWVWWNSILILRKVRASLLFIVERSLIWQCSPFNQISVWIILVQFYILGYLITCWMYLTFGCQVM